MADINNLCDKLSRAKAKTGTAFSTNLEDQTLNLNVFEVGWKQLWGQRKVW